MVQYRQKLLTTQSILLGLSCFFCLWLIATPCLFAKNVDTLRLKQFSPSTGQIIVYLNPKAFRIERGSMITVARAPDWQVYSYNLSKRAFVMQSFSGAINSANLFGVTTIGFTEVKTPWKKDGTVTIAALETTSYSNATAAQKTGMTGIPSRKLRYWLYSDKTIPFQCSKILSANYGLPYVDGLPIRFTYIGRSSDFLPVGLRSSPSDEKVGEQPWLDTKSAEKVVVPDTFFAMPKGYRQTDNYTMLFLGNPLTKDSRLLKDLMKDPEGFFQSR